MKKVESAATKTTTNYRNNYYKIHSNNNFDNNNYGNNNYSNNNYSNNNYNNNKITTILAVGIYASIMLHI